MIKINKLFSGASEQRVQTLADLIRRTSEKRGAVDDARTEEVLQDAFGKPISDTARAVIMAGRKRRNELPEKPQFSDDKAGRMARAVINAGRKARNEEPI